MKLEDELRLSYYKRISPLNEKHGVYLVQHIENGRVFVMKRLTTYSPEVFRRLMEEPVPGTPRIYDVVEDNGTLIVIEQYIDGDPLSEIIKERGPLPEGEVLAYAKQLAVILHGLHSMEPPMIHRDIKPSNVMLSSDGTITLIDLDAAKLYSSDASRDTELIGTEGYAAPEQYGFGASGPETDIYSFGVLLSVLLTGKLPSDAKASGAMGRIIKRCTNIDPKRRYPSAKALLSDLNRVGGDGVRLERNKNDRSIYRPLGFRSLTPWKMILATACYALTVMVCFFSDYVGSTKLGRLMLRLGLTVMIFSMVLFSSNFCGVLDKLGINRIRKTWIRVTVIVIFNCLLFILFAILFWRTLMRS